MVGRRSTPMCHHRVWPGDPSTLRRTAQQIMGGRPGGVRRCCSHRLDGQRGAGPMASFLNYCLARLAQRAWIVLLVAKWVAQGDREPSCDTSVRPPADAPSPLAGRGRAFNLAARRVRSPNGANRRTAQRARSQCRSPAWTDDRPRPAWTPPKSHRAVQTQSRQYCPARG